MGMQAKEVRWGESTLPSRTAEIGKLITKVKWWLAEE
jgi:hypothetical protein